MSDGMHVPFDQPERRKADRRAGDTKVFMNGNAIGDLGGVAIALASLHHLCEQMEATSEDARPAEDEFQIAMYRAARALQLERPLRLSGFAYRIVDGALQRIVCDEAGITSGRWRGVSTENPVGARVRSILES